MKYLKRIPDDQLKLRIEAFGAVQIKGPKWCDKTLLLNYKLKCVIKMHYFCNLKQIYSMLVNFEITY